MFGIRSFKATVRITTVVAVVSFIGIFLHWISSLHSEVHETTDYEKPLIFFHRDPRGLHHPKFPPPSAQVITSSPTTERTYRSYDPQKIPIRIRRRKNKVRRPKRETNVDIGRWSSEVTFPTVKNFVERRVTEQNSDLLNGKSHADVSPKIRQKRDTFSWEIRANVTYNGKRKIENDPRELSNDTTPENFLSSAVLVQGKDTEQDGTNFFGAWNFVGQFFDQLFRPKQFTGIETRSNVVTEQKNPQKSSEILIEAENINKSVLEHSIKGAMQIRGENLLFEEENVHSTKESLLPIGSSNKQANESLKKEKLHVSMEDVENSESRNNRSGRIINLNWFGFGRGASKKTVSTTESGSLDDSAVTQALDTTTFFDPNNEKKVPNIVPLQQDDCVDCLAEAASSNLTINEVQKLADECVGDCNKTDLEAGKISNSRSFEQDCENCQQDCEKCQAEAVPNSTPDHGVQSLEDGCVNDCDPIEPDEVNVSEPDFFDQDCDDCQEDQVPSTTTKGDCPHGSCQAGDTEPQATNTSLDCNCEDYLQPEQEESLYGKSQHGDRLNMSNPHSECGCDDDTNVFDRQLSATSFPIGLDNVPSTSASENRTLSLAELAEFCFTQILSREKLKELSDSLIPHETGKDQDKMLRTSLDSPLSMNPVNNEKVQMLWSSLRLNTTKDHDVKILDESLDVFQPSQANDQDETLNRRSRLISFKGFLDFFGSGSSARMIEDTNEEISLNDLNVTSTIVSETVAHKPIDPNCVGFFRDILSNENHITKPNLMDVIVFTNSEAKPVIGVPTSITKSSEDPCDQPCSNDYKSNAGSQNEEQIFSGLKIEIATVPQTSTHLIPPFTTSRDEDRTIDLKDFRKGVEDLECESCAVFSARNKSGVDFSSRSLIMVNDTGNKTGAVDETQRNIFEHGKTTDTELGTYASPSATPQQELETTVQVFNSNDRQTVTSEATVSTNLRNLSETPSQRSVENIQMGEDQNGTFNEHEETVSPFEERRFFGNLFGSGDGRELARNESDERRFFGNLFGSGDGRDLADEEIEAVTQEIETNETERRWFLENIGNAIGGGSGDGRAILEQNDTTEAVERSFFGFLFGSGEAREIADSSMSNLSTNIPPRLIDENEYAISDGTLSFEECDSENGCGQNFFVEDAELPSNNANETVFVPNNRIEASEESWAKYSFPDETPDTITTILVDRNSEQQIVTPTDISAYVYGNSPANSNVPSENFPSTSTVIVPPARYRAYRLLDEPAHVPNTEVSPNSTSLNLLRDSNHNTTLRSVRIRSIRSRSSRLLDSTDCGTTNCSAFGSEPSKDEAEFSNITNKDRNPRYRSLTVSDDTEEDCDDGCEVDPVQNLTLRSEPVKAPSVTEESLEDEFACDSCNEELPIGNSSYAISDPGEGETNGTDTDNNHISSATSNSSREKYTPTEESQTICSDHSHCSSILNEQCLPTDHGSICGCGRAFVRSPTTKKCDKKVVVEVSLRFPDEDFSVELNNRRSRKFKQMKKAAEDTIWLLIETVPEVARLVVRTEVLGFSSGSLVVHWTLVLATPDDRPLSELTHQLDSNFKGSLQKEEILQQIPFHASQASVLGIQQAINPCDHKDLNYCGHNANCIRDENKVGGFSCQCRLGYVDVSGDAGNPGEICRGQCEMVFCGDHGNCSITKEGQPECLCRNGYFGKKCQISGVGVVAGTAVGSGISVLLVALAFYYFRWQKKHHSAGYGDCEDSTRVRRKRQSRNLQDTMIVDNRLAVPSKFEIIQTPPLNEAGIPRPPQINVVPPSVSDNSCYLDSTFDSSTNSLPDTFNKYQVTSAS